MEQGYAALNSDFDSFYTRRLKKRLDDCFSRPVTGVAGRTIVCYDRDSHDENDSFQLSGTTTRALNVSSYNYLGFASSYGAVADAVETCIRRYGVSGAGPRHDASTLDLHQQAEKLVARFTGAESAMVVSMGFATNSTTLPALVDKGCMVISDEFNHASIRFGVRLSGASVRSFKHNDMQALEALLREVVSQGQPRTHRPWKKILIVVEGLYSMEGSLVNLPALMDLKRRYKVSIVSKLSWVCTDEFSSIFTSTRRTQSVLLDRTAEGSATISALILAKSTFSWEPSPNPLGPLAAMSRDRRRSSTDCASALTPCATPRACPHLYWHRSSQQ